MVCTLLPLEGPTVIAPMAKFEISYDSDRNLTHVVVEGDLYKEEGDEIIRQSREAAAANQSSLLYDVREARSRVSLADWFFLPRRLDVLQDPKAKSPKVALVVSAEELGDYRFYEDVAQNAGLSLRVFLNETEALAWQAEED